VTGEKQGNDGSRENTYTSDVVGVESFVPALAGRGVPGVSISLDNQKAIFWGEFVGLAYSMYAPRSSNPPQPPNFPNNWRLVTNITVEAVVGFYRQTEFIGFVAQSVAEPHHFAVVLHGTEGIVDFLNDFEFLLTDFDLVENGGRTEDGFTRLYESFSFVDRASGDSQNLTEYLSGLDLMASFTVAGASLGGALATLHAAVLASRNFTVEAYLFASPMVGNAAFTQLYNSLVPISYRIVNKPDIVPLLPGMLLGYVHVNTEFLINSLDFPEIKCSIRCFHSLNTYLYTLGATHTDLGLCRGSL